MYKIINRKVRTALGMGAVSFLRDLLRDQSGMYAATPFKVLILLGVASSGAWGKPFDSHHPLLKVPQDSLRDFLYPEYSLPIEKAMFIHNKWDYSLDQIYLDFSQKESFTRFSVDIRDFISIEGESVIFSIPDYYWEYINEIKRINESDSTSQEKNRLIKKLEAKYTNKSKSVVWKRELPISDFLSMFMFGKKEIPYAGDDHQKSKFSDPTEEQLKELSNFLNEIFN